MEFKALSEFIYVGCKETKKGNGFYIVLVDEKKYDKYGFYSRKKFDFEKGQKVVPILEVYCFSGETRIRLKDLEGV